MPLQSAVTHPNPGASHHFPGVYQIGEVKARSCNVILVPGNGWAPKRFAS